jgi:Alcohol acetyltransferase
MQCQAVTNRKQGPYEVMTHLFHDLGIQSNIFVSARYSHTGSEILTPAKVSAALASVVHEHTALSIIGITQPSEKKKGNHRLWEARLPSIAFQDCVEFIDDQPDGDEALSNVFENAHNEWFDAHDTSKPWWKLIIVNGKHVVFVYHHSIGDGLSGHAFHRSLLAALNEKQKASPLNETAATTFVSDQATNPLPNPLDQIDDKLSWLHVISHLILWHIIRFFINQKHFLFSDATFSKSFPTAVKPLPVEERTVTKVQTLRIKKDDMKKCLDACRQHNTSFTALLQTLILVTLATDIYPKAKIGFSRLAVNIRPLLRVNPGRDVFTNAASQYARKQFLGKYRAAGRTTSSEQSPPQGVHVNVPAFWELARRYKADMSRSWKSRKSLQDFLTGKLLGEDDEEVGTFYGLGLYQNNGFLISNLGAFEPKQEMANGGWKITDVGFSAGEIRAALGDAGIIFNVSSVKEGDCLIIATYEEGVLESEMVRRVLGGIMERLKFLL